MTFGSLEWYLETVRTIDTLYREELLRPSEALGNANWLFHAREEGWNADRIRDAIRSLPEWHAIHVGTQLPPAEPRPPLPPLPAGSYDRVLPWTPPKTRDFIRADAWAVPVPGLPFVPGGSSEHPERLLTPFIYKYDRSLWPACFDAHRARGYTHWILWWPNFRADGGSVADFAALCQEIQAPDSSPRSGSTRRISTHAIRARANGGRDSIRCSMR